MANINVEEILSKAQEMQEQFKQMQKDFEKTEMSATSGIKNDEEMFVTAVIDGMRKLKKLTIGAGVLKQGAAVIAEFVINAVNEATDKLNLSMQEKVKEIYKHSE